MYQDLNYEAERMRMVENQLRRRDIRDERLLDAMGKVPRHMFVDDDYIDMAKVYMTPYIKRQLGIKGDFER